MRSLRWWTTFGGIGARTRRGCGSLYCATLKPINKKEAGGMGCELVLQNKPGSALQAWKRAVHTLYEFRQGAYVGRKKKYGKSLWPEADAIRKTTNKSSVKHTPKKNTPILFPRAMFGMPIIFPFKSKSDNGTPPETELLPMKGSELYDRLASPLILKPITTGDGNFQPAALLMPYEHLCKLKLHLKYQNKNSASSGDRSDWTFNSNKWWNCSDASKVDPIIKNNGTDALTAFMNFFAEGGA